jgi:hypothetical protein
VYDFTVASVESILAFRPHWGLAETAELCRGVLSGLSYLHDTLGLVHGRLSLSNIHLTLEGTAQIRKPILDDGPFPPSVSLRCD